MTREVQQSSDGSSFEINTEKLEGLHSKTKEISQTMRVVIVILIVMVAQILVMTTLWLVDSFKEKQPQVIYHIDTSKK